jgi:hypothetical protein
MGSAGVDATSHGNERRRLRSASADTVSRAVTFARGGAPGAADRVRQRADPNQPFDEWRSGRIASTTAAAKDDARIGMNV